MSYSRIQPTLYPGIIIEEPPLQHDANTPCSKLGAEHDEQIQNLDRLMSESFNSGQEAGDVKEAYCNLQQIEGHHSYSPSQEVSKGFGSVDNAPTRRKKPQKSSKRFSSDQTALLVDFHLSHKDTSEYPTTAEKKMLAEQANLTHGQVHEWFKNRRRRYSKLDQEQHQNYAIPLSSSQGFTPSTSAYQHSEILTDAPTMAISEYDNALADRGSFSDVKPGMASPTLSQEHQPSRRSSSSPSLQRYISASPQQDPGPSGLFNSLKNSDKPLSFHTANYNNHHPNTGDRISHEGVSLPNDSKQKLVVSQSSHSGSGSVKRKGKRKHRQPQIAKTRDPDKIFQCNECCKGFPNHSSRVRHLRSQHYKQEFVCMYRQPFSNEVHGCIFCDYPIISDEEAIKSASATGYLVNGCLVDQESFDNHLSAQHKIHKCSQKSEVERSFPRKDSFERHLQVIHHASASASKKLSAQWQKPFDQEESNKQRWCGFCQFSLDSPKDCEAHVSSHFANEKEFFDMTMWHKYGESFSSEALGQDHTADPGSVQSSYDQHFDYYDPSFEQEGGLLPRFRSEAHLTHTPFEQEGDLLEYQPQFSSEADLTPTEL